MKDMYIVDVHFSKRTADRTHHSLYLLAASKEEAVKKAIEFDKSDCTFSEEYGYFAYLAPKHPAFR